MFSDYVMIEITSADIVRSMNALNALNIEIHRARIMGELSAQLTIATKDYPKVSRKIKQDGGTVVIKGRRGVFNNIKSFVTRPVMLIGILVLLMLSLYLPGRVLFIEIAENEEVSDMLLLQEAAACGLRFGASRRALRSEEVKNQLLERIPQLQWVGVNTSGCVATISVRERDRVPTVENEMQVTSIVASTDGIITQYIVRKGNRLCDIGQAVKTGQLLVSGFVDCGIVTQAVQADAEIVAQTLHKMSVITPVEYITRSEDMSTTVKYSLQIGKKLINFFKDSGISDVTCVKMYKKKYLMLPGGYSLPIAWIVERHVIFESGSQMLLPLDADVLLRTYSTQYLSEHMIAGRVLSEDTECERENGVYALVGTYHCREMIGQIKHEESLSINGENS